MYVPGDADTATDNHKIEENSSTIKENSIKTELIESAEDIYNSSKRETIQITANQENHVVIKKEDHSDEELHQDEVFEEEDLEFRDEIEEDADDIDDEEDDNLAVLNGE